MKQKRKPLRTPAVFLAISVYLLCSLDALALAEPCNGPFKGAKPDEEALKEVVADHQKWVFSHFERLMGRKQGPSGTWANLCAADLNGINITGVDLSEGGFGGASLKKAVLADALMVGADFTGADLSGADLSRAVLRMADFTGADLSGADLAGAEVGGAKFNGARLNGASLAATMFSGGDRRGKTDTRMIALAGGDVSRAVLDIADFTGADMDGVLFEPAVGNLSAETNIHLARNLQNLRFADSSDALLELRAMLRKAGHREAERQITYSVRHGQRLRAPFPIGVYEYLLFELPTAWGMAPGRALIFTALLALIFAGAYAAAMRSQGGAGFWRDGEKLTFSLALPLLYSLLSVFQVNWGGPVICQKAMRLLPGGEGMEAQGWVLAAAWAQSALSLYLVMIWMLAQFGRPFG